MPLRDIRVLDVSIARSGPVAVRQFADLGAQVIRVEAPGGHDMLHPTESDYINLHRNKRTITIDLKLQQGQSVFYRLARQSDILIENYRPQVKHELGIDYETLSEINPALVYGSISGFGQTGPYAAKGGVDQIVQGMGGLMSVTGYSKTGPTRVGIAIADLVAGYQLAFGVLAALNERRASGKGQWVHVSLLEAMIATMDFQAARWTIDGDVPGQVGNDHPTKVPMSTYPTSDGFINIAASSDRLWLRLCEALDEPGLANDPRYQSDEGRRANRTTLNRQISDLTMKRRMAELWQALDLVGVPAGPIYAVDEVFADRQVKHLDMTTTVPHPVRGDVAVIRPPVNMSRTPASVYSASPMPGENRDDILHDLGYSAAEIDDLIRSGAV